MKTRELHELLGQQEQLSRLRPGDLETLAGCAHLDVAEAGEVLAREDDPADVFFVVRTGLLSIQARVPGSSFRVDSAGPGELVGWSWIFPPHRWHFDVRAAERSRLVVVDGACLRTKCERDHEFGYRLMVCFSAVMVKRLVSARLRLLDPYGSSS